VVVWVFLFAASVPEDGAANSEGVCVPEAGAFEVSDFEALSAVVVGFVDSAGLFAPRLANKLPLVAVDDGELSCVVVLNKLLPVD
jgi:hypothetical protein